MWGLKLNEVYLAQRLTNKRCKINACSIRIPSQTLLTLFLRTLLFCPLYSSRKNYKVKYKKYDSSHRISLDLKDVILSRLLMSIYAYLLIYFHPALFQKAFEAYNSTPKSPGYKQRHKHGSSLSRWSPKDTTAYRKERSAKVQWPESWMCLELSTDWGAIPASDICWHPHTDLITPVTHYFNDWTMSCSLFSRLCIWQHRVKALPIFIATIPDRVSKDSEYFLIGNLWVFCSPNI